MIKLSVIGNLGKDAVSNTVGGKTVINFSVAHTEKYKDAQGNQKERVIWCDCSWWQERTAILPYLKRGTSVYLEGQPDVRTYTTKEGVHGATLTLRVSMVQLLGSKPQETSNSSVVTPSVSNDVTFPQNFGTDKEEISELPF